MQPFEVLLVEDDVYTRAFLEDAMAEMNVVVRVAGTAAQALDVLTTHPRIRLAFVDRLLPDADGRALCHQLKRMQPDIKLVQMSSHPVGPVDADVVHSILDKPFTIETLEMLVTTLTEPERGAAVRQRPSL